MRTRRTYNIRCKWWKVDEDNPELSELIHEESPKGVFFARESQITNKSDINDNGIIDIDQATTTIETMDDITGIEHKDLVEYMNKIWIVEGIQNKIVNKQTQYNVRPERIWWISLRTGD